MAWSEDTAGPLAEAFDGLFGATGVVVAAACIDEAGTSIQASPGDAPADGRFDIGSITKTMTATLLALLDAEGALGLDDPVGRWLPAGDNGGITLRQLATHTSGLPRLAPNHDLRAVDPANPYAGFTYELAEEGLRQATVTPGAPWVYSNFGYHLLGRVLERASGLAYQDLIAERLLEPLGMSHSGIWSNGRGLSLPGHDSNGEVPHWDPPLGAGGVQSTIGDLARYALACLNPPAGPLGAAITAAMEPQDLLGKDGGQRQGLAWLVWADGTRAHNGGTSGFASTILIDPGRGRAVAVLASCGPVHMPSLDRAGKLALAGDDPRAVRPEPLGPEWEERAREAVQLLLDGRTLDFHARTTSYFQGQISAEHLEETWRGHVQHLGTPGEMQFSSQRPTSHVIADVSITFEMDTVELKLYFEPSGEIAGIQLL
jgi:CubicO group peptidase (beta-lactamase class C family)